MAKTTGAPTRATETGGESESTSGGRLRVQALAKGLAVIGVFDIWRPEWTIDEIADEIDLPKMNVYRLLKTMEDLGYVVSDPATNRFHLGPAMLAAGYSSCHRMEEIIRVARPYLENLAKETEESVSLAVEVDGVAIQMASIQGSRPFRPLIAPGRIAHWTSHAKLFAALRSEREQTAETPPYINGPRVIKDSAEVTAENKKILAEGLAYDLEERELGSSAVAAPVFDQFGEVVASLAIVAPPGRFQSPEREFLSQALKKTASSLSRYFGYLPSEGTAGS